MKPNLLSALCVVAVLFAPGLFHSASAAERQVPRFEPDPYWPKNLPNNWMLGQVGGIFVDSHDHIWVTSRPRTLDDNDKYKAGNKADCCVPSPAILEFDMAGNLIQ